MTAVLVEGLHKNFRDGDQTHAILSGLQLRVAPGEKVAIIGPSGSGKSTLLHILGGLDPDYQGSVVVGGQDLRGLGDAALARFRNQALGFVFQSYNLLSHLSVLENTVLSSYFSGRPVDWQRARDILASLGLGDKLHRRPAGLSGGERQRVAIARALYHRPKLVLCDEPTGNLDGETALQMIALFERLSQEGAALLIATHDHKIAETAHRTLLLRQGRLQPADHEGVLA